MCVRLGGLQLRLLCVQVCCLCSSPGTGHGDASRSAEQLPLPASGERKPSVPVLRAHSSGYPAGRWLVC